MMDIVIFDHDIYEFKNPIPVGDAGLTLRVLGIELRDAYEANKQYLHFGNHVLLVGLAEPTFLEPVVNHFDAETRLSTILDAAIGKRIYNNEIKDYDFEWGPRYSYGGDDEALKSRPSSRSQAAATEEPRFK